MFTYHYKFCSRYSANFYYNSTADELIFKKLSSVKEKESGTKEKVEEESIRVSDNNEESEENNSSSNVAAVIHTNQVTTSGRKPIVVRPRPNKTNKHSLTSNYLPPPSILNLHLDLNKTETKSSSYHSPKHQNSATYLHPSLPPSSVSYRPPLIAYMSPSLTDESFPEVSPSSSIRPPSTSYISPPQSVENTKSEISSSHKSSSSSEMSSPISITSINSDTESSLPTTSSSLNSSYSFYIPPKPVMISSYESTERNNHLKISLIRNNGTKPFSVHKHKETKESIKLPYLHKNIPNIYDVLKVRTTQSIQYFLIFLQFISDIFNKSSLCIIISS